MMRDAAEARYDQEQSRSWELKRPSAAGRRLCAIGDRGRSSIAEGPKSVLQTAVFEWQITSHFFRDGIQVEVSD